MSSASTTQSAPAYRLAQRDTEGRLFYLTGLGEFPSSLAAGAAWRALPRNGVAYVVESRELSRFGVVYGSTAEIVATV